MFYNNNSQNRLQRGHFTLKSSVLAPTAMSYIGQDLIANHMKSHYRRVLSAKAAVDTSPPKSLKSHIKVRDQKKRASLESRMGAQSASSLRTRSPSMEFLSASHDEQSPLNSTRSRPSSGWQQLRAGTPIQRPPSRQSSDGRHPAVLASSSPRRLLHYKSDNRQTTSTSRLPLAPPVSPIRKDELRQAIRKEQTRISRDHRAQETLDQTETSIPNQLDGNVTTLMLNSSRLDDTESKIEREEGSRQTIEPVEVEQSAKPRTQHGMYARVPHLDLTELSFSHRGPRSMRPNETEIKTKMWEEEQQYLKFITDVTTDVLARGIFSNRVLNQVFEMHIERRREDLDEGRLRDMIEELKDDLGISDS